MREIHLSQHYGVSRTPIRQVLHRLEFEGLVEIDEGRGARVSALDPLSLQEIWAVRLRIAEMVGDFVKFPVKTSTLERIESIRAEVGKIRESRDATALGALYNRFHDALLTIVDNSALFKIHDLLYVQTARVWNQFLPRMDLDREIDVMEEEIDDVLGALRSRDGAALSLVRAEHMRRLLSRFNQQIANIPAASA